MKSRDGFAAAIVLLVVLVVLVAGGILWVHYFYLPHMAASSEAPAFASSSTSTANTTASATPSPETAQALQAIQYLLQQNDTFLSDVPTALTLNPVVSSQKTTFSLPRYGFSFTVPWEGISKEKTNGTPVALEQVTFNNGRSFVIMQAPSSATSTLEKFGSVSSTLGTEYGLENAALYATPGEVTSSTPGATATLLGALIVLKSQLWPPGPVYSFDTGIVEGFQHGNASTTSQVDVDFFYGGNKYNLIVAGTQGEIDSILESIKSIQ